MASLESVITDLGAGPIGAAPSADIDLYDVDGITEPYANYRAIRDAGRVVWLPRHGMWAMGRYDDVRAALADHELFSSAGGPGANMPANEGMRGTILASDPPEHDAMRQALGGPLSPGAMREIREQVRTVADDLIADLVKRERFDGVSDLAHVLPLTVVRTLVGLPPEGRENMLTWAAAAFDVLGPEGDRAAAARQIVGEEIAFVMDPALPGRMEPGGWGFRLFEAAESGLITRQQASGMVLDLINPSLDTTINATTALLVLLGHHPDQYDRLRADPSLIPHAVNEAIRLESPIRGFTRVTTRDQAYDGVMLPKGARVMVLYASANRDERKWTDPERFDITRKPSDHLGFGYGVHSCVGMHLARLEIQSLFESIVRRVERIEIRAADLRLNNLLRGFATIDARFVAAA